MVRTAITKEEPSRELKVLRQRVAELEALEAEHQQTDKKLLQLEDEQRYKAVFESANDVIMLMDKKGRITDVNDKLREIIGYDKEKLVGKNLSSLINIVTKKSLDILSDNFQKRVAGAHVPPYEIEIVKKDGELLTLEVNARAMKKDGRIIGDIAILRDVTERKRAETEYKTILQTTIDGFWLADMQGRFLDVNDAYCQLVGYNRDELLKMSISDIEAIEKPKETAARIARIKKVGRDRFETYHRCKDGRIVNVEVSVNYIEASGGRMVVFIRDITEREQAELALRMSEQNLKEAQTLGRIGNWEFDFSTQKIGWSDEVYKLYERDKALGPPSSEEEAKYYAPEQTRKLREYALLSVETGKEYNYDLTANLPGGKTLLLNASMRPIKDEQGQVTKLFGTVQDITERKQVEQVLRESEQKYRLLSDNVTDIVWTMDVRTQKLNYISPSVERIRGYTPAEAMEIPLSKTMTPASYEYGISVLMEELERDKMPGIDPDRIRTVQFEEICKDGSTVSTEARLKLLRDAKGLPIHVIGITRDITERKRAEEVLRQSEGKYAALVEKGNDTIVIIQDGVLMFINSKGLEMTGFSMNETLGRAFLDFVSPESRGLVADRYSRRIAGESVSDRYEIGILSRDGAKIPVEISASIIEYEGRPADMAVARDISERKQAEQELRASESRYRFLSENMADIAFTVDLNMRTTYVSLSVERVLGFTPEERMRQLPQEQLTPESFKSASATLSRELGKEDKTGKPNNGLFVLELEYYHKDGSIRIMETNLRPIRDEQGKATGVYGLCHDITERKKVEDALKVSEERFRRLAENAQDIIFRYRQMPSPGFDYISPAVLRISDYAPEEFYADPLLILKISHLDSRSFLEEIISRPQDYLEKPVVLRWVRKDGETIWTEQRSVPVYDDGKIIAIEGIIRNITERKQMEEEAQRNYDTQTVVDALLKVSLEDLPLEKILRRSLDLVLSIPWLTLEQKGAIFLVEGEPNVLVMKAQSKLAEPIQKACARMPFGRCLCGRAALTNETQFADCLDERHETRYEGINPHGHYCVPITFGGKVLGVINTYTKEGHRRDKREEAFLTGVANTLAGIIERKRIKNSLRISEENFRNSLDSSSLGIRIVDEDGNTLYANRAMLDNYGYESIDELNATRIKERYTPESYAEHLVRRERRLRGEPVPPNYEISIVRKDTTTRHLQVFRKEVLWDGKKQYQVLYNDITEQKHAQEVLLISEESYRNSIDNSPMGVKVFNRDEEIIYANRAILDIYGYNSIEELRKTPVKERYTPESYAEYLVRNEEFKSGETTSLGYELSIRRKDGGIRHLQAFRKEIIWDGQKQFQLLYNDITERKKAEDAMRESRARFRELTRLLPLAIWETDANGTLTYTNEEAMRAYGYSRQDAAPSYLQNLIPQDRDRAVKNTQRLLQGETLGGIEYAALRKDGSTFPALIYASAIIRNGKGVGLRGITVNTAEQKIAEKRLEQAAQEWRTTFDSITDMVCILGNDSRITRVNMAYANMLKKEPQELLGKACYELIHKTDCPHQDCPHQKTLKTGKPAMTEFFEPTLGIYIEGSTSPVFSENGDIKGSILVMRDISERKQMEQQLMLTDRLASVGELASGVAHELNNPLTSVIGFSQLLMEGEIPDSIKEDLSLINSEAQRAANVVKNLLTFARKHAAVKQASKINNVIEDVLKLRAYEQKVNNIEVIRKFASDLPEIMVDYFQIQQVILNLIINAEFFMTEAHRRGTLTISIEKVDHAVKVSFADDGAGIPQENLKRIFDPFFTTKEVGKGTGLGLSICHGIITEHGGKIYAESEVGKGATFIIELPINGR